MVQTRIGFVLIAIVTGLARLNDAVTATRQNTSGEAPIGIVGISVVAGFGIRLDKAITTTSVGAEPCATVAVFIVAVVAVLPLIDDGVATTGALAEV